ncbi:hypothetical protein QQ045_009049 [Rhodiola kirilowii]
MADLQSDKLRQARDHHLPQVLMIKEHRVLITYLPELSNQFKLLNAYESPLPILDFLATYGKMVKAMICSGATKIDLAECRRRGVGVANAGGIFSEDCADLAVGLLIDVLRNVTSGDRFVRTGNWPSKRVFPLGSKLGGKRVGILGLGSIGTQVAKRMEAYGCSISYNSRKPKPSVSYPFYSNVSQLAANSDVLIICCALTPQTHHMVNMEVLRALGKDGVVVNIARGAIVDEKELVRCLVEDEILGAGLDVFENEPNVPIDLFAMDNVVMSPHTLHQKTVIA